MSGGGGVPAGGTGRFHWPYIKEGGSWGKHGFPRGSQLKASDDHARVRVLSASGIRRYWGARASAEPKSRANAAWNRARGRYRSSRSGGTSAPAASSTDRYRTAPLPTQSVPGDGRNAAGSSTRGSSSRTK